MAESLHDLMIVKKEIEGLDKEIDDALQRYGIKNTIKQRDLLKKLWQAEIRLFVKEGKRQEGTFRVINNGRTIRKINITKLKEQPRLYGLLEPLLTVNIGDAVDVIEEAGLPEDTIDEITDKVQQEKYDIVDLMED